MSVRDLISAAYNKDAASFESTLHAVMQEKMAAAIQSRFSPAVYEEEVDLEEEIKDGDKVSWHDPDVGKNVTGVVTMASGMKRKGIKHAQVRIDNSHGTTTKVPHSQLKKISEEVDLEEDEMCEDLDQIDEISKPTVVSYLKKAQQSKDDASGQVFKGAAMGAPANDPKTLSKRNKGMDIGIRKIVGNVKVPATEK